MPPAGVVWLSTEGDPAVMWVEGQKSECRIKVVIPSTDKRLVRWEVWVRKHQSAEDAEWMCAAAERAGLSWRSYYVYFGTVPRSKFRAIEYADPRMRAEAEAEFKRNPQVMPKVSDLLKDD